MLVVVFRGGSERAPFAVCGASAFQGDPLEGEAVPEQLRHGHASGGGGLMQGSTL